MILVLLVVTLLVLAFVGRFTQDILDMIDKKGADYLANLYRFKALEDRTQKLLGAGQEEIVLRQHSNVVEVLITLPLSSSAAAFEADINELRFPSDPFLQEALAPLRPLSGVVEAKNLQSVLEVKAELPLEKELELPRYLKPAKEVALFLNQQAHPTRLLCGQCHEPLRSGGMIHEQSCERCHGRFVPFEGVEKYILGSLELKISDLKEQLKGAKDSSACPACRTGMAGVLLRDTIVDLCPGCGGMWFEKGELYELSNHRIKEV